MKATKTLLAASAVSALAVAGSAEAATVQTYNVGAAITSIIFHFPDAYSTPCSTCAPVLVTPAHDADILVTGGVTNAGTAVLDDAGTLTITGAQIHSTTTLGVGFFQTLNATFTGTMSGTDFTPTAGSFFYTACVDLNPALPACSSSNAALNTPFTYTFLSGSAGLSGGTVGAGTSTVTSISSYAFNLTPVPVPAAMWLFGSGLLGLAGTARRRRAV